MAKKKPSKIANNHSASAEEAVSETELTPRSKALVFVSHDSRDHDIAEAFGNLLSDVSAGTLKSFRSSDRKGTSGLEFGAEWYAAIMSRLDAATDVVALFTTESIDRPWILYEAGVAKGKLETTVFGVAMGVPLERVSTGPFAQFQNCGDDEDSLTKLVMQLLLRNPDAAPREEAVRTQVRVFRETVTKLLASRGKRKPAQPDTDDQSVAKLFEEVKAMMRELPEQIDENVRAASNNGKRRFRRFHPRMIEDVLMRPEMRESSSGFLIVISTLRDDFPWLYELGLDVHRALKSGNKQKFQEARAAFSEMLKFSARSKLTRMLADSEDEETFFILHHLPEVLDRFLYALEPRTKRLAIRKAPTATG